jgi:hypothetical protein
MNMQGQVVLAEQVNNSSEILDHDIDLTSNPSGIYFVRVQAESESWVLKIVRM